MSTRRYAWQISNVATLAGLSLLLALSPQTASAQSAQMWSLQVSGIGMYPFGGEMDRVDVGGGYEAQLRVNPGAFSLGAGIEQTWHNYVEGTVQGDQDLTLIGGFVEPRYVVDMGMDNAVLYLSARIGVARTTRKNTDGETNANGFTTNGGGGVLVRLGDRTNLDVGATLGYKNLGEVDLPGGGVLNLGTGANAVGRIGLSIGLG